LGGRTEFMEKYLKTVTDLNCRGLDVFSMDWRGQGLSGRMLSDPQKGYIKDYRDYVADLDQFMKVVVLPQHQSPLILMAHSMGGNIALQFLERFGTSIDRVILTAPLIRINMRRGAEIPGRLLSRWATRMGLGSVAIPFMRYRHTFLGPFQNNGLTSDRQRFYAIRRMIAGNRRLAVAHVTYAWLNATFDAIDHIHESGFARKITAPVLMVEAEGDRVVSNNAIHRFAARLPRCRLTTIRGACHEIMQEKESLRLRFWRAFDMFVH
jgi:lysophospholipase